MITDGSGDEDMSYSDDQASQAAPFFGDGSGSVFDTPDMLLQSQTTSERIIDTQSGFLVVVKKQAGPKAGQELYVRRQLGTPPSSSVALTPDESIRLSRVLIQGIPSTGNITAEPKVREQHSEAWIDSLAQDLQKVSSSAPESNTGPLNTVSKYFGGNVLLAKSVLIGGALVLITAVCGSFGYMLGHNTQTAQVPAEAVSSDPLNDEKVDEFARGYIANLLDFNPQTYKASQIRAMAAMSPELLEKYWKETNFPLNKSELKALPQSSTIMINKVLQERVDDLNKLVDVVAQMTNSQDKVSVPVQLRLKLSVDSLGHLQVVEQRDISTSK